MDVAAWWACVIVALESESMGLEVEDPEKLEESVMCLVIDSMMVGGMEAAEVEAKVADGVYGIHLAYLPDEGTVTASLIWRDGQMSSAVGDVSSLI